MRKAKTDPLAKRPDETFLQWRSRIAEANQNERDKAEPIVPNAAQQHGDYRKDFVTHVETNTKAHTAINRGGDAVARWIAQERLTDGQQAAIGYVARLWQLAGHRTPLTANYGERLDGSGSAEHRANGEIEARRVLHRIQDYIPGSYWNVFENVVRHGIAAGTAGAALGHARRDAKHTAYLTVCFVADIIVMKERL